MLLLQTEGGAGARILHEYGAEKKRATRPFSAQSKQRRPDQFGCAIARHNHIRRHGFPHGQPRPEPAHLRVRIMQQRRPGKADLSAEKMFRQRGGGKKTVCAEVVQFRFPHTDQAGRGSKAATMSECAFQRLDSAHFAPRVSKKNIRRRLEIAPDFRHTFTLFP